MKKIRILSIDGGGIRGIIPGTILAEFEKILQRHSNSTKKIGDYFDMIAGTSTGGILACIYLMPGDDGNAKYSAQDAVNLYIKNGHTIFARSFVQKVGSLGGISHQKYSQDQLYKLLTTYFGDVTLDKVIKPSLITSYEITDRKAVFFTSADARADPMDNFYVRDVARATSAAPTYFSPAHIKSMNGQSFALIDGGVFANNPALCAYAEARKLEFSKFFKGSLKKDKPTAADMFILSLGTGSVQKRYSYDGFKNAGEIKWLEPIIDILMSGNSETVAYQLRQMYLTLEPENQKNYYRLEPGLKEACSEMDEATPENIQNLYQAGLTFVHDKKDLLEEIAQKIVENE
ncbi:MAG TPA: patatin-like phospholipase family protein [Chitinophagaceae bacterium]|nr:patatin-like phospholipase family protein [Chitinophagaceae bacterium]